VVVNLKAKKRLAARVTGVGVHRIKFDSDHLDDVADAITRENIRSLITANTIQIRPFTGTSRGRAQDKKDQKNKRGTKQGSKQGRKGARVGKKEIYVAKVRSLRRLLKIAKDRKDLTNPEFWALYKKVGGNTVRNKAHLRQLMEETIAFFNFFPIRISSNFPIRLYNSMARDNYRIRIFVHNFSYSPLTICKPNCFCQFTIGGNFSLWNFK
jgi:large subunit ribosomal protein L19e